MTPRGIRLNNPLNIRRGSVPWVGQAPVQDDPSFVRFLAPEFGFRAAVVIWLHYRARGLSTLAEIVSTWAPASENDVAAYLADVSRRTGFHPEAPIDVRDPETALNLCHAFTWHENGEWPFEPSQVRDGVALALQTVHGGVRPPGGLTDRGRAADPVTGALQPRHTV